MYNLLMVGAANYWTERDTAEFEWTRFLEHTQDAIAEQFNPLTPDRIAELLTMPALFAVEFSNNAAVRARNPDEFAHVGRIVEIRRRGNDVQFKFELDRAVEPVPMEVIADAAWDLDINVKLNENHRSHWAVKDVDLLRVLSGRGVRLTEGVTREVAAEIKALAPAAPGSGDVRPKVFIVHGRDDGLKNEVALWLHRIGMDEVILHEQPNQGRTIIAKFRDLAADAVFAVVLATPDDVGSLSGAEKMCPRPRQNVVLELGFFIGALGPERVAALVAGDDIEMPSDYDGVLYTRYDNAGGWKLALLKEFLAAGIPFDATAAIGR
ncbi:MAG: nucleotide-binding protein containing TIR-like domain protein [Citromicrobium sp.]|nr:nucleotide-binding protein containing TIR-like domain protein [Citromicrobium sp.]